MHMKQSQLFTKTRRNAPKDEVSKNAELLIRGGYIHKEIAGVYDYLPLGLIALNNIVSIIREEMNAAGGEEVHLSALQDPAVWEATGRWDDAVVDNWFKTALKSGTALGLGFTHEEPLTRLMKDHISSYRDLPRLVYQFQTKFRNELRAKSGIMRGREFLMKDLYSFVATAEEHEKIYERMKEAYRNVFNRVGLGERTYLTYATGGSFSKYSHEFQTETENGEDTIHVCDACKVAVNEEIRHEQETCPQCGSKDMRATKAVEVGNIFSLGTKFSDALGLVYKDESGNDVPVVMGSYGIGPGRVMGTIVEVLSDKDGIVWPESVAPFRVHVVRLGDNDAVVSVADDVYAKLQNAGVPALYDDREGLSAGEKLNDADLLGMPMRIVVSEKSLAGGGVEIKNRTEKESEVVATGSLLELFA